VKVAPSYHFFAPNSFSPNGDGLNDVFKPIILGHQDYKLLIYDRWGHQVFYSDELAKGWDGTLDDKPLKSGIYVYRIYVTEFLTNLSFQETGTLNLFR
jgi:gliding motility-associated-like protein